ncbi:hypothetical protein [Brevibacillus massiliensis]|uniref:hypothetical protein n=1 Tax=Brevibacillus massiliensis TaxID=1118054 RepID=UPI0002E32F0D|nr:hypothetical protein [Brevibacillus massiliensis]
MEIAHLMTYSFLVVLMLSLLILSLIFAVRRLEIDDAIVPAQADEHLLKMNEHIVKDAQKSNE